MSVAVLEQEADSAGASAALQPLHPGEILWDEYMVPLGLTKYRLAQEVGLSESHVGELVSGKRNITAATALRLAAYFGNTPEFWLNLQAHYDLTGERRRLQDELRNIPLNPQVRASLLDTTGR